MIARTKPASPSTLQDRRRALHEAVAEGGLPLATAVARMREALGMSKARFA
jgi:hypothetical protein